MAETPRTGQTTAAAGRLGWLLLPALLTACAGATASRDDGAGGVAQVRRGRVEDVFLLTGEVQAVRSHELTVPRVEGGRFQVRWLAEDGSEVEPNGTVVELDNAQIAQGLEERRLRLTQAQIALEGRLASLEADVEQKRLDFERAEVAVEKARIDASIPQELRSRKEWHEKQQLLRKAEAALEKARLALATAERAGQADLEVQRIARDKAARDVAVAERSLKELSLRAPKGGIVLINRSPQDERPLQVGDNVFGGWRVASIPDLSSMEIVGYLAEVDEGRAGVGQAARIVLDAYPGRPFQGRVEEVAAVAQDMRVSSGFRVRVSLQDSDPALLRPGFSARVEIVRRVYEDVLLVPRSAVVRRGDKLQLRNTPSGRDVDVAACLDLECVITRGVSEGDRVALR